MKLKISPDLSLPLDTVTSTLVVYGGKGMGKTNFGGVLVEELTRAGLRWSALDPLGVWWGLRHSRDGKGPGIECVILGGAHGDITIEPTGGAIVADLVVDETANVIIDFSRKPSGEMWSIGEKVRFVTDYANRIFQRQGELVNGRRREPIFQLLDEAARYIPQLIPSGAVDLAKCVGAWETLVEEGRNVGIGVGLLTQRSARMNKSVSEVADAIFAFRIVGPNSIKAITDWLGEHCPKETVRAHVETIRSLERGSCLIVSPGWLTFEAVAKIRARETFDSSATPKAGERPQKVTGDAAKPDLAKYADRMKASIERAKENDPAALKKTIQQLKAELAKKQTQAPAPKPAAPMVDSRAIQKAVAQATTPLLRQLESVRRQAKAAIDGFAKAAAPLNAIANLELPTLPEIQPAITATTQPGPLSRKSLAGTVSVASGRPATPPTVAANSNGSGELNGPEQRILNACAWLESIGVQEPKQAAVAFLAGYTVGGGAFNNPRGALRGKGLIDYRGDALVLTPEGRAHAVTPDQALTQEELHNRVLGQLPGPEQTILRVLLESYPKEIENDILAELSGYAPGGGAFNHPRGRLRTLGLVEYPRKGFVQAAKLLFLE